MNIWRLSLLGTIVAGSSIASPEQNITVAIVGDSLVPSAQVWAACEQAAAWATIIVVPPGILGVCDDAGQSAASAKSHRPILIGCRATAVAAVAARLTDATGTQVMLGNRSGSIVATRQVQDATSNITIGAAIGDELWDPLLPRELSCCTAQSSSSTSRNPQP